MTLGMDAAQLSRRVKELENELSRVKGASNTAPRSATPAARPAAASSTSALYELEAELEEVKDELLTTREELDELKHVSQKQRITML